MNDKNVDNKKNDVEEAVVECNNLIKGRSKKENIVMLRKTFAIMALVAAEFGTLTICNVCGTTPENIDAIREVVVLSNYGFFSLYGLNLAKFLHEKNIFNAVKKRIATGEIDAIELADEMKKEDADRESKRKGR